MRTIYKIATEPEPVCGAKLGGPLPPPPCCCIVTFYTMLCPAASKGSEPSSGGSNLRKWVDGGAHGHVLLHVGDSAPVRLCICERGQVIL